MKLIFAFSVALILFAGCKKESHHSVAIYSVDQSSPGVVSVNDAILDDQLIFADRESLFYSRKTTTFAGKRYKYYSSKLWC